MSPLFRKCGVAASQDVLLYKSLYLNPLSCSDSHSTLPNQDEDYHTSTSTSTTTTSDLLNSSSTPLLLLRPRTSNSDFSTSKTSPAPSLPRPLTSVAETSSISTHSTLYISSGLAQETCKDRHRYDDQTNWSYISSSQTEEEEEEEEEDISGPTTSCNCSHAAPALKIKSTPTPVFPLIRVSAPKCVDKAHTGCTSDVEASAVELDLKEDEDEEEGGGERDDAEGSQLNLIRKHGIVTRCTTSNEDIQQRNMRFSCRKKDDSLHHHHHHHHHHHNNNNHHHCKGSMIMNSPGGAGIPQYVMWADPESYTSDHATIAPVSAWSTLGNRYA